jgi:transcriptional regulator with XRE-family HTH domain
MVKTIYSNEYKRLVQKLKKARLGCGLNQVKVGKLLKKDQTFVSKVEAGQYRLDAIQLCQFAKIYKKDIKHFLS